MKAALSLNNNISLKIILKIHLALTKNYLDKNNAGKIRTEPVWIGGSSFGPGNASFVPPHEKHIKRYLNDLVKFYERDDINSIFKAAVAHAQFETIHPFIDGNGRTGRALIQSSLKWDDILQNSSIPISIGLLNNNIESYFNALNEFHNGKYVPIIRVFSKAIDYAISISAIFLQKVDEIYNKWQSKIKARSDSNIWNLLNLLIEQPVVDANFVINALKISSKASYNLLSSLENKKVVKRKNEFRREVKYVCTEIVEIIDKISENNGMLRRNLL
jgi:Fic family protein